MKDFLLVSMFSKNESNYITHYTDELRKANATYDVAFFERYNMEAIYDSNEIVFRKYCPTGGNRLKKVGIMLQYARFIRKLAKTGGYKGLLVFTTVPAIMLYDILIKRYLNSFVLDIRDYTHEKNKVYYLLEEKLIDSSYCTVISSAGFKQFLPKNKNYILTHNIPKNRETVRKIKEKKEHYTIGFVGSVRYYKENCALIDQFKSGGKYDLKYYGTISAGCDLEGYCKERNIEHVSFMGQFNNSEKNKIYRDIDIINSIYGDARLETKTAIPNRLYDAAIYKCPIIASKGTFLGELVEKKGLGFATDVFRDDIIGQLDSYLSGLNYDVFYRNCENFISEVDKDMQKQSYVIDRFIKKIQGSSK